MMFSNYIIYRSVDYTITPASYTDPDTGLTVTPAAYVASPKGTVILTQMIDDPVSVTIPSGFAMAEDASGAYPIGSIYTPS